MDDLTFWIWIVRIAAVEMYILIGITCGLTIQTIIRIVKWGRLRWGKLTNDQKLNKIARMKAIAGP